MKIKDSFLLIIFSLAVLIACNTGNNEIIFSVNTEEIIDSLESISLNFKKEIDFKNYFYDLDNYFYINSKKQFKVKNDSIYDLENFNRLSENEKEIFVKSIFLKKYGIYGAYKHIMHGRYVFGYKDSINLDFDLRRDLILVDSNNHDALNEIKKISIILDRYENLILVKPRKLN